MSNQCRMCSLTIEYVLLLESVVYRFSNRCLICTCMCFTYGCFACVRACVCACVCVIVDCRHEERCAQGDGDAQGGLGLFDRHAHACVGHQEPVGSGLFRDESGVQECMYPAYVYVYIYKLVGSRMYVPFRACMCPVCVCVLFPLRPPPPRESLP